MVPNTRRDFLRQAAVVGWGLALAPYASLAEGQQPTAETPTGPIDLAIARWDPAAVEQADLQAVATQLTEHAMANLGGMGRFVNRGDTVWVKPNIGWNRAPELAANTNPDVVATLVRLCLAAGAKQVKVGDFTCHPARQSYVTSGVAAAAEAAGATLVYLDERRFKEYDIGGKRLQKWPVWPDMVKADLVINVPIAKHHGLSKLSLAMKNYMGVVGEDRGRWHQDLATCLCDITAFMKPRLSLLDAVRVLTNHGPQGGNPADVAMKYTSAASTDIVALDAFGAELMGAKAHRMAWIRAAHEAGLGNMNYRELALREAVVS